MELQQTESVVFYDGNCLLCSRTIQFLIRADKQRLLKFAPQQGEHFKSLKANHPEITQESIIFFNHGRVYSRSTATLAIINKLPYPWKILYALIIIPRFLRDAVYITIARNREQWFGVSATCFIGDAESKKRFLS